MREMDVSMVLLTQLDVYHLQERTGPKEIGAAGLIGCFGGKEEDGETPKEAITRELPQETNITANPKDLRLLDEFSVESDHQNEPVKINATVFGMLLPYGFVVEAREGRLVSWKRADIEANQDVLTPATKEFFRRYFP